MSSPGASRDINPHGRAKGLPKSPKANAPPVTEQQTAKQQATKQQTTNELKKPIINTNITSALKSQDKGKTNKNKNVKLAEPQKKPLLWRSQSLYSPLSPKLASSSSHTAIPESHQHHNIPSKSFIKEVARTSPTSSVHLQGSAKLQRYPLNSRQNTYNRLSKKSGSISSTASTVSSPSSPSSTMHLSSSYFHHSHGHGPHHHHGSGSSSVTPLTPAAAQKLLDQNRNIYEVQEKAYIKKMNNEFTDDYATKAIDTKYNRLDMESDSDASDSEFSYDEGSEDETGGRFEDLERIPTSPAEFPGSSQRHNLFSQGNVSEIQQQLFQNSFLDPPQALGKTTALPASLQPSAITPTSAITFSNAAGNIDKGLKVNLANNIGDISRLPESKEPIAADQTKQSMKGLDEAAEELINKACEKENDDLIAPSSTLHQGFNENILLEQQQQQQQQQELKDAQEQQLKKQALAAVLNRAEEAENNIQSSEKLKITSDLDEQHEDGDEFKEIFGDADAEDEEDNNITYAAEISRIASDKLNDTFQIDDGIIYPLVKPRLKSELLEDPKFLERFEWQVMLGVVIKSDIVTAEKNKMMKKLNFGTNEENINITNAHGNEAYLSSFFINQYKENLWLSLKAKRYSRDLVEQKRILSFSRSLMDEVIEEIMNFKYDKQAAEKTFYKSLIEENKLGLHIDVSVLEQDNYKDLVKLTVKQEQQLETFLFHDASKVIETLLEKYENCEQLWITHEEMYVAKPVLKQDPFAKRLQALISWKNIISALYSEKDILISWFKNDAYYRNNIENFSNRLSYSSNHYSQEYQTRHSSSLSSSVVRLAPLDEAQTSDKDNDTVIEQVASENDKSVTQKLEANEGVSPTNVNPKADSDTNESVLDDESEEFPQKYNDINELNAALFAENILNYKDIAEMVHKKIFSVINPWSKKAKESYLSSKEIFEEMNLPSYLPILLELVKFPSDLIREVVRIRLHYAKKVTQQTLMGIDQTIIDFKVIIKLCFQVKENLFKFLNGVPDINLVDLEIDYEESDVLLLEFIDYLLVLFHRKLLDSSRSPYSFTTYKEPEILEKEWLFLRNIGYFLEVNSAFKLCRNFLFLISGLVARLLNYINHQMDNPALETKLKFIKWYTTSFDNYNNVKRNLTKFTNSSIRMVQNAMVLHLNFNKDFQIAKILLQFLRNKNHSLIMVNGTANLHNVLYNKGKFNNSNNDKENANDAASTINSNANNTGRNSKRSLMVFVFASEELSDLTDREIIGTLQGSRLGCDLKKPSIESLDVGSINGGINIADQSRAKLAGNGKLSKNAQNKNREIDSESQSGLYKTNSADAASTASVKGADSSLDKEPTPGYGDEKRTGPKVGYMIVLPVVRHITWDGKVRNINLGESQLSSFPKLVSARYGNALLLAPGSPMNLNNSKLNFINDMKKYCVEESDLFQPTQDPKSNNESLENAIGMFDKLTVNPDAPGTAGGPVTASTSNSFTSFSGEPLPETRATNGIDKKLLKLIKTLRVEKTCSLLQIQKELVKINKNYNKMSFIILEKGLRLKEQILLFITENTPDDSSCLEIVNNLFYIIRDTSLMSLKDIEPPRRGKFLSLMIAASIEWIKVVVDVCIATEQKTFRWCVSALEFAVLLFQKFNVLLLTDAQFAILKAKVAGCLSLLISHFDIMGARSNKADKVLLSISKLQRKAIQKENFLALHKNTELSEKIEQLDQEITERLRKNNAIGKVLDNEKSENKFLAYLSSSFSKFSSKWQKGDYLGGGTFGSVYTATDLTNGNVMAVKEVKFPNSQMVTNIGKVIKDEMTVLEMLNHPNIVHYYGVEVHSDKVYLFMEYCDCGSLDSLLRYGRLTDEWLIQWYTFQMVEGLAYLHLNNITHRDIKPENILLNRRGVIKFVDFGAAKVIASSGRTRNLNPTGSLKANNQTGITGTPMYLSPESITGHGDGVLGSADIWALGCCVLEMCTGRRPWSKLDNEYAIMFHIANGNKPQLPENGELSEAGLKFLNRCFESRPDRRATAQELINDPWLADMKAQQVGYESNASSTDLSEGY